MARKKTDTINTNISKAGKTTKKSEKVKKTTVRKSKKVVSTTTSEFPATIFDSVYHTIVTRMPQLIIPVINDAFKTRYSKDVKIEQLRNRQIRRGHY